MSSQDVKEGRGKREEKLERKREKEKETDARHKKSETCLVLLEKSLAFDSSTHNRPVGRIGGSRDHAV